MPPCLPRSETGNFFEYAPPPGGFAGISLAFDYTFLCALEPSMRPKWGKRYGEVVRPGGLLICLAFPIGEPHETVRFGPSNLKLIPESELSRW